MTCVRNGPCRQHRPRPRASHLPERFDVQAGQQHNSPARLLAEVRKAWTGLFSFSPTSKQVSGHSLQFI
jgi:hypothetical protein